MLARNCVPAMRPDRRWLPRSGHNLPEYVDGITLAKHLSGHTVKEVSVRRERPMQIAKPLSLPKSRVVSARSAKLV